MLWRLLPGSFHSALGTNSSQVGEFDGVDAPAERGSGFGFEVLQVDVRLPGKGNSNSQGARSAHLIITMMKWIRTSRLSIKNSLRVVKMQSRVEFGFTGCSGTWSQIWGYNPV